MIKDPTLFWNLPHVKSSGKKKGQEIFGMSDILFNNKISIYTRVMAYQRNGKYHLESRNTEILIHQTEQKANKKTVNK